MLITFGVQRVVSANEKPQESKSKGPVITLEEAQRMIVANNPTFRNVQETVVQANSMIQSAWSMLLPNLSAKGSIIRNQQEVTMSFPTDWSTMPPATTEMVIQDLWAKSFGFSANITLLNPRAFPLIKLAYDINEQTKLRAMISKNDLLFAVTAAYYQIGSLKELMAVSQETLETAREFERNAQARVTVGQATRIDLLRAQLEVKRCEKDLGNVIDTHDMAKQSLAYLIGLEGEFSTVDPTDISPVSEAVDTLKERAMKERLEVQEAALQEKIAQRSRRETQMKWLPTFDLTYNWNWNSAAGFSGQNDSWMLIFGAKWSLLEGGGRLAQLKERGSKIRMAQNSLAQLFLDIRKEVDQNYKQVKKQQRNVDLTAQQVLMAEENHRMVTRQYEVGMASSLDVLNATTTLSNTRNSEIIERLNLDIATLTLRKSVGEYASLATKE